jgi:hypothetical protein
MMEPPNYDGYDASLYYASFEIEQLKKQVADLLAACEAAIPILKDYRDFMGQVGAYGQPAELAEDGGYSAIAVSDVCQTALDELTAAIAAARPKCRGT